jgi:hypothetical protein
MSYVVDSTDVEFAVDQTSTMAEEADQARSVHAFAFALFHVVCSTSHFILIPLLWAVVRGTLPERCPTIMVAHATNPPPKPCLAIEVLVLLCCASD